MDARTTWPRPNSFCYPLTIGLIVGLLVSLSPQALQSSAVAQRMLRNGAANGPVRIRSNQYATTNFVITAPNAQLAKVVGEQAEIYRKDLALKWLGYELEPWPQPCPITVEISMHAGGETSFAFVNQRRRFSRVNYDANTRKNYDRPGTPLDWQMKIFGPANRVVDSVLPHEITHTIFATHFGQPLPRWADEGACTTVEHESERSKNHRMLMEFLTTKPSRGIPFNRMFTMKQYPHDILPLYAQGYSLCRFLIEQKGHQYFVDYVGAGLANPQDLPETKNWDQVTREFYGYEDLSDLQIQWLDWVRQGSKQPSIQSQSFLASTQTVLPKAPEQISQPGIVRQPSNLSQPKGRSQFQSSGNLSPAGSWYARQARGPQPAPQKESVEVHRVVEGVQHKVSEPASSSAFLPGSIEQSTLMRKPATTLESDPMTIKTSDQRHQYHGSASTIWR